jgi:capsular exopolysaccharide synthesis family protein
MSKFFKALDQAQRDRALKRQSPPRPAASPGRHPTAAPPAAEVLADVPDSPAAAQVRERVASSPHARRPYAPPPLPSLPVEPTQGVDDHLVSLVTPAAFEAEQYRALRHMVEQRHKSGGLTVLGVSSPAVGDGKTTTAINLAGALAQAPEARVLLVEADLRRPSIGAMLGFGELMGRGLVHAILDPNLNLDHVVRPRPPFNLDVILAGEAPPSPYEILKSPRLGELLDAARQQYDYVILDTPPLVGLQDCRVIARWVDGLVVVVAAHRTPRRLVDEALSVVDPSKIIGLIFNGDDPLLSLAHSDHYAEYHRPRARASGPLGRAIKRVGASLGGGRRRGFEEDPDRDSE